MKEIINMCSRDVPHADWIRFSELDFDEDVASLATWISGVFEKQPSPFPIQGLWVGLCSLSEDDQEWADMYVGALAQYNSDDEELGWLWSEERHYPENAYANSVSLRSIYKICYGEDGGLENDAEWPSVWHLAHLQYDHY